MRALTLGVLAVIIVSLAFPILAFSSDELYGSDWTTSYMDRINHSNTDIPSGYTGSTLSSRNNLGNNMVNLRNDIEEGVNNSVALKGGASTNAAASAISKGQTPVAAPAAAAGPANNPPAAQEQPTTPPEGGDKDTTTTTPIDGKPITTNIIQSVPITDYQVVKELIEKYGGGLYWIIETSSYVYRKSEDGLEESTWEQHMLSIFILKNSVKSFDGINADNVRQFLDTKVANQTTTYYMQTNLKPNSSYKRVERQHMVEIERWFSLDSHGIPVRNYRRSVTALNGSIRTTQYDTVYTTSMKDVTDTNIIEIDEELNWKADTANRSNDYKYTLKDKIIQPGSYKLYYDNLYVTPDPSLPGYWKLVEKHETRWNADGTITKVDYPTP